MDNERKKSMEKSMQKMDEEMSMLTKKFKLTNASDIIAMYQTYLLYRIDRYGIETY